MAPPPSPGPRRRLPRTGAMEVEMAYPRRLIGVTGLLAFLALAACEPETGGSSAVAQVAQGVRQEREEPELIAALGLDEDSVPVRQRPGWSPPERIVVRADRERVAWLQQAAPGVELVAAPDMGAALRSLPAADAVIGYCSREVLEAGPRLKWIQLPSAGAEYCVRIPAVAERGLLVTNAQRLYGPEIAEHVMAMLLAFSRGLYRYIPQQGEGSWSPGLIPRDRMWELDGKTMLVVGLGGLGTEVARDASALGMRVLATRRSRRAGPEFVEYVGLSHELFDLAGQADVVVNTTPLTAETTGLFDAGFFATMKPTAYFINVGRGRSVVTADLVEALRAGAIAGAGLDVTDPEPLPPGHPLWSLPNVIITPHVAGRSDRAAERLWVLIRENLSRYVAGERMLSVVNVERGY